MRPRRGDCSSDTLTKCSKVLPILIFILFMQTGYHDSKAALIRPIRYDPLQIRISEHALSQLTPHEAIDITSDEDFEAQGWPGSGTENDPYIIAGLLFEYETKAIDIQNVDSHFVVENCTFISIQGAPDHSSGVYLRFVSNGVVRNCVGEGLDTAIEIYYSSRIRVENNSVLDGYDGMRIFVSSRVKIDGNRFTGLSTAMVIRNSHAIEATNNQVNALDDERLWNYGMDVYSTDELTIENSSFSDVIHALQVIESDSVLLANSQMYDVSTAVSIDDSVNVSISSCNFTEISATSVSLSSSENCSVTNTAILGPKIRLYGGGEAEWTHTIANVSVNGTPVGFFRDLESSVINGTNYSQLFLVFSSAVEVFGGAQPMSELDLTVVFSDHIQLSEINTSFVFIHQSNFVTLESITLSDLNSFINVEYSDNVELMDMSSPLYGDVRFYACENLTITRGQFNETDIDIGGSTNVVLSEIIVDRVYIFDSYNVDVSRCIITSSMDLSYVQGIGFVDTVLQESGILPRSTSFDTIRNVTVNGKPLGYVQNTGPGIMQADLYGQIILASSANIIVKNGETNGPSGPIYVLESSSIEIRDVVFQNNEDWDITVQGSQHVKITGILVESTGILVEGSSFVNISQSEFRTSRTAIQIEYSDYVEVSDSTFFSDRGNDYYYTLPSSIMASASGTLRIADNEISGGHGGVGIFSTESRFDIDYVEIVGNSIRNCTTGIEVWYSGEGLISSNRITDIQGDGIRLIGSQYWNITFNEIAYITNAGIFLDYSYSNNIYGNLFHNNANSDAYDVGSNNWDNGGSIGNCWSSFDGETPVSISESDFSFDNYPLTTSDVGFRNPIISNAPDVNLGLHSEGRLVQWVIWISESIQYEILKNGLILDSGTIDRSGIIGTNITRLGLGSHNYTLVVRSDSGDSKKDTVFV
ncbi:MAG: right-handed parallel beta-helix repeat-containing protein, partial [Candidatus Thorarchaeota archaeon]